jgi:hypothetical protein
MAYRIVQLPPEQPAPPAKQKYRVAESTLRGSGVGSFLTSIPEGIPVVGPYVLGGLQRAGAYGRSVMSGQPYDEELKTVQGMTEQAQSEHPYLSTAGNVVGAAGALGPVGATEAGAAALGLRGSTLVGRAAAGAGTMGTVGAADSAVRSGGDPYETAKGGVVGAVGGAAGPYVGEAAGAGWRYGRSLMPWNRPGGSLSSVSGGASRYAANAAPSAAQVAELQRLGPHATLADISPEWMGVARGAAARPGNRDAIVQALLDRQAGANQRLGQDLDTSLGSVRNPGRTEAYLDESRRALGPEYERALVGARAVDTQGIADALDTQIINIRGDAQRALQRVRNDLNIHGQNQLDPHPRTLLSTRRAIDGMLDGETNRNVIANLTEARRMVDAELTRAVSGIKDVDAQFAELSRQSGGLTRGSQVLDSGKTAIRPEDLAEEMRQGALPQGTQVGPSAVPQRMQEGARAEIDRVAGTSANDPVALQRLVKGEGDWNRDKLRTLFGPQADDALNAIDRETIFNRTANRVTSGSDTAMATGFADFLNRAAAGPNVPHDLTITGLLAHAGKKALGLNTEARAARYAGQLGRASVATGADRDALIAAIQDYTRRRALGQPVSDTAARLAQYGLSGSLAPFRDRGAR